VDGASAIYHLAGKVSRNPDDGPELYRVHVQGTSLLCREAKRAGVERFVLASTSGTIAVTEDGDSIPDESHPPPLKLIGKWPYYTSKLYQEETAKRECQGGPELVIMNPSLLLGPGDRKLSSTEDVLKLLAGDIPVVPPGGVSFVDARDAAAAFENALTRGRSGERYLLGGPNWSFETFFKKLARIGGVKGPRMKLPERIYSFAGKAVDAFYRQWELTPPVDRVSVEMGSRYWWLDASKAERELGFHARDPYETLNDTVAYVKKEFLGQSVLS
ncbi:MAG: NAD-dependent epimerase/dehydratase family protein, partial [Vicinamibacteria bacterium]